jgi:hypothetical protein
LGCVCVCVRGGVWREQEVVLEGPEDFAFARQKLFAAFKGNFVHLALSKFGCWAVEKMFAAVDNTKKVGPGAGARLAARLSCCAGCGSGSLIDCVLLPPPPSPLSRLWNCGAHCYCFPAHACGCEIVVWVLA